MIEKFYTVAEAAKLLKVSRQTIYRLIDEGKLPAVRLKRCLRIQEKDLREFIKRHKEGGFPPSLSEDY